MQFAVIDKPMQPARAEPIHEASARIVARYLRFLGCARDAVEDLVQEAILASLARWPAGDAPLPWLLATARNLRRKQLRTIGRRRELVDCDELHKLWQAEVDDDGAAMQQALQHCLEQLPAHSRQLLELRYGTSDGTSTGRGTDAGNDRTAIGRLLGLGAEGVKSRLVRVRAVIGDCVRRRMKHATD